MLKNGHLLRFPYPSSLRRTTKYASLLRISGAFHLALFEQPGKDDFFSSLLISREEKMIFLFNQHWDIIPGKEAEYTRFAINHYIPTMKKIGINPVGGFYVVVGEGPRVISVGTVDSLQKLQKAMETEEYEKVTAQVQRYVFNYCSKILKPTGRVKMTTYRIQLRVWKFNQYFNIIPGKEKEYSEFVSKDHLPTMEKLGIKMTGGWQVVVGPGPYIVAEGTATSIVDIAKALESDEYKRITNHLTSTYITDYSSRILAPTGRIELPYLMEKMMKGF